MSESTTPAPPTAHRPDIAGWLLLGTIGTVALSLGYVHAPLRLKLPLLSPVALGALTGWGLGRWAASRHVASGGLVALVSAVLILACQVGMALETYRLGVKAIRIELNKIRLERDPFADQIEAALADAAETDAEQARLRAEHVDARERRAQELIRLERQGTFAGYLELRIPRAWGRWPPPYPELFWGIEICLATAIGGWLASRSSGRNATQVEQVGAIPVEPASPVPENTP